MVLFLLHMGSSDAGKNKIRENQTYQSIGGGIKGESEWKITE